MNPKSRMVLFAVISLFGWTCAQAAEPWYAVTSEKGETFYASKAELDRYLDDNRVFEGSQSLYHHPWNPTQAEIKKIKDPNKIWPRRQLWKFKSKERILADTELIKRYGFVVAHVESLPKDTDARLGRVTMYNMDDHSGKELETGSWLKKIVEIDPDKFGKPGGQQPEQKPEEKPVEASKPPEGVDQDVWDLLKPVKDSNKSKILYAQVLQKVKKDNAKEYTRLLELQAAGKPAVAKVVAAMDVIVKELQKAGQKADAAGVHSKLTAKKSGATSRLDAALDAAAAAPAAKPQVPGTETEKEKAEREKAEKEKAEREAASNPVNVLTKLLAGDPAVGKDMAERIAQYVLKGEDGKFISAQVRKDEPKTDEMVSKSVAAWVESRKAKKPASVAEVYFVLGAERSPAWLKDYPALSQALADKQAKRTQRFLAAMKIWANAAPEAHGAAQCSDPKLVDWLGRFLGGDKGPADDPVSAINVAHEILSNTEIQKELGEIAADIARNADGSVVPGGTGKGGPTIKGPARGFGYDSLYKSGAFVNPQVYASGDPVSRAISLKIYTVWEADASGNKRLVDKIGIYDITYPGDTYGRKFDVTTGNTKQTFPLDDRSQGLPKYTFKTVPASDGSTMVYFGREGNDEQMGVKLSDLYAMRANQAITENCTMDVGGKSYYVLGQGGQTGSLLFFPADTQQRLDRKENVSPELAAEVNKREGDRNVLLPGKRRLGVINDEKYNLSWNKDLGYWEAAKGDWDPEPSPKPTDGQTTTGDQTTTGGQTDPTGTPSDAIELQLQKDGFKRNTAVRDGLRPDDKDNPGKNLRDKVRVWSWAKSDKRPFATRHCWVFPAELMKEHNLPVPVPKAEAGETDPDPKADEIRGIVHYIATSRPTKTMYFDLDQPTKVEVVDGKPQNHPYPPAGYVNGKAFSIAEEVLLADAMQRAGYDEAARKAAAANLAQLIKDKGKAEQFNITTHDADAKTRIKAATKEGDWYFYPEIAAVGSDSGQTHTDNPGPGHAFDFNLGPGGDEPFEATPEVPAENSNPAEKLSIAAKAMDDSAVLYVNGEKTRWYLMYRFTLADGKTKLRSKYGWVFANGQKEKPAFPTGQVFISGLGPKEQPKNGEFRFLGDKSKGLWYGVSSKTANRQNSVDFSKYCLGPVIWWGMEAGDAREACNKDKL